MSRFKKASLIPIDRYGEIFNRKNQSFRIQKKSPSLILARKHNGHVLKAPAGFGIGDDLNFYFSHMYNCLYDCEYCFLQGMYSSASYVVFVNYEDFELQLESVLKNNSYQKITFFSGYDCDSLAFENVTGFVSHFLPFFQRNSEALLELRTKSYQLQPLLSSEPIQNCVVAFSLMPEVMALALDHKAPSIKRRIEAMKTLSQKGWRIGLRFDPLIYGKNWKDLYSDLLTEIFEQLPSESIHSITYGALRFPKKMHKIVSASHPNSKLFVRLFQNDNGIMTYGKEIENDMIKYCTRLSLNYVSEKLIFHSIS